MAYVLPYAHGLIAGNFVSIVTRFASLLESIVQTYNEDRLIDPGPVSGTASAVPDTGPGSVSSELLH
ncbi:hypothetical protein [Paraburkholderia lacunae]|uniref:Uncharacterized protein n=1 Tax=Paraburkholderia lacunae TaxID=2211104 RepID=A0A370NGB8_9BURK|nr:hypothetical protein [Paraburkholderia lacunae]RDK04595.1 hypothetical protein DLM46_01620 [Paraburkholderia lacunae]